MLKEQNIPRNIISGDILFIQIYFISTPYVNNSYYKSLILLLDFQIAHNDVATQMDEYAPLTKPTIIHRAKFFVVSPPKKYKEQHANNTVDNV